MLRASTVYGVLRALRARKQTPGIMLTAAARRRCNQGLRDGADDYSAKPFSSWNGGGAGKR